jgi:hypothetical protein
MNIDFSIDKRIKELTAKEPSLNSAKEVWAPYEEAWAPILADIITKLEPMISLEELQKHLASDTQPKAPWEVFKGPGVYALVDTVLSGWHRPAITWIGQTDYLPRRIAQHQRAEQLFDSVRAVFIEDEFYRKYVETRMLDWFSDPEKRGYAETLGNKQKR